LSGLRPDWLVVVAGTGTEVGKTWVATGLTARLRASGAKVLPRKPAQSFDAGTPAGCTDAGQLAAAAGCAAGDVCPPWRWYAVAMAPPMAAEVLGRPPFTLADLARELRWPTVSAGPTGPAVPTVGVLEIAGGVRSPQAVDGDAVDLVALLRPDDVIVVADAGLGTINSVRLSVEALVGGAARSPADVVVVLNRYEDGDSLHRANRSWLSDRYELEVLSVPGQEETLVERVLTRRSSSLRGRGSGPSTPTA
jgi:dethiobiotin synthetase